MGYDAILDSEIQPGKPISQELMAKIKGNQEHFYLQTAGLAAIGVPNGSFEIDSDADGVPDGWTVYTYPGGSSGLEATDPAHGATGYKFVHPGGSGNGGGYLTSDYIEASELEEYILGFYLKSTNASTRNKVEIRYYNKAKVDISQIDVYDSQSNPTSWSLIRTSFVTVTNTRYIRIRIYGGTSDVNQAGTIYFDGLTLSKRYMKIEQPHDGNTWEVTLDETGINSTVWKSDRILSKSNDAGAAQYYDLDISSYVTGMPRYAIVSMYFKFQEAVASSCYLFIRDKKTGTVLYKFILDPTSSNTSELVIPYYGTLYVGAETLPLGMGLIIPLAENIFEYQYAAVGGTPTNQTLYLDLMGVIF